MGTQPGSSSCSGKDDFHEKRLFALVSLLLCTVLLCLPAAAAETEGPALTPSPGPVRVWGTLTHLEDGGLLVKNSSTEALNSVILHGEDILCLDAVTGEPMELSELKDGRRFTPGWAPS